MAKKNQLGQNKKFETVKMQKKTLINFNWSKCRKLKMVKILKC